MEERIKAMEKQMNEIHALLYTILSAMEGNKISGDGGIVGDIRRIESKVKDLKESVMDNIESLDNRLTKAELFISKINSYFIFAVSVGSAAVTILGLIIAYLSLNKH